MCRKLIFLLSLVLVLSLFGANAAFGGVVDIRIAAGDDDAEQHLNDNRMDLGSSDLELVYEDAGDPATDEQVIGLRFVNIPIPKGAEVTSAYVEFEVDKVDKEGSENPVNLIIEGELTPDAPAISDVANNLTDRTPLTTAVAWSIPAWTEKDAKWQTSDIAAIIQEIIDQDGWAAGNALVLIFSDNKDDPSTGLREAESYNGEEEAAPLLHVEFSSKCAYLPVPADGAVGVVDSTLEWTPGDTAVSHMIYLSTDETIDESDFLAETNLSVHFADLEPGTTYYWRVDEVGVGAPVDWDSWEIEPGGDVVNKGDVWSFTTMTIEAHDPSPSDGATSVAPGATLSWTAGKDAIMHDVYFGTDKAAVEAGDASTFVGKQMEASFDPGPLEMGTMYYWKVDEFAVVVTNPGPLWSFMTEEPLAFEPEPQDGEEDTVQSPVLSFSAGMKVVEHDVYFGDDPNAVADANTLTAGIYVGRQAETSYEPGELEWDKTYYWRVDGVGEADPESPWKGTVWSFTTADYLIIDLSETVLDYDNSAEPFTTEASWDTPQDLTINGVTNLQFRFQGAPGPQGSVSLDEATGTYTINGSGADVWGSSDQFHYMYRELSGDATIIAHVVDNGTGSNNWAKGGVMIRQSLDAGSTHALMAVTGSSGGGGAFQWRPVANEGSSSAHDDAAGMAPGYWMKLERVGDALSGSYSPDGVEWTQQGDAQTIEMKDPVLIGLFVTSHQSGEVRTYTFDNVSTKGKVGSAVANQDIGIAGNSAEKLYLAVEDSAGAIGVVTHPDIAATQIDQWWTMKVPLLAFSDAGVDVADANKLYIGVGDVDIDVNDVNNLTVGGTGSIRIDSIKGVKPIVILEATDVTAAGDNVRGVPNDGDWPGAETPPLAVDDNSETKYLHFKGDDVIDPNADPSGFKVTPLAGATIVTGLTFTTANDAVERDPTAYELYGSNVGIDGPYNLIASGDIVDFSDPNTAWPRFTMNVTPITFDNAAVYKHYQVLFPAIRDAESANSMQIAEVELIGVTEDVLVDITSPGNLIYGYPTDGDWPGSESPLKALDDDINTNYRHKKGETQSTGLVVTPSSKKVVNRLTFTTAGDAPERDPVAFKLYGSDSDIYSGPWTSIASGTIDDFNQETAWPRQAKNETPIMFDNDVAYKHYRIMITEVRDAGSADSMQLAEVELIEALN